MNKKIKNIMMLVSIAAMIGLVIIIFSSLMDVYKTSSENNRNSPMIPRYILWTSMTLMILVIVPISYFLISKRLDEKLEKNMEVISKLLGGGNTPLKTEPGNVDNVADKNIILKFLSPNERTIIRKLIEKEGTILQSEITRIEWMGKLKTHRAVEELKRKGIIKTEKYGKTNRIILEKDVADVLMEK
ncbi:MAG: hypothetical protein KAR87_00625 [Candidatus Aenigmarchaeota archaeon]|nr:hypothetical protein [Candidatus Aenigmarchaeota archaeon]